MVHPFAILNVDWITKLPKSSSGNKCIIVCVDALTKWTEAKAYPSTTMLARANFLSQQIVFRFSAPEAVASDKGTDFAGHF